MVSPDPAAARQFAREVVDRLRAAGFEALWAGGCVRDQLLGGAPKDYDVATNAEPDQVASVFGRRRTLAVGAAFGVVAVIGNRSTGNVEVATFRRDAAYSDGRHPDNVVFSTAEEDAKRRDFTINGMFYDPRAERVIDYVGGERDLAAGVIRAIGNADERFNEDKLRILRAVRFATVLDFQLEQATFAAIVRHADELVIVSAERIAAELRKMLTSRNRRRGVELLAESCLLEVIVPESRPMLPGSPAASDGDQRRWRETLTTLAVEPSLEFPAALALLIRQMAPHGEPAEPLAGVLGSRLKLSNDEMLAAQWLIRHESHLATACDRPWPEIQRLLIEAPARNAPAYLRSLAAVDRRCGEAANFCQRKLALPAEQLNPPPLLTGMHLKQLGLKPGPHFRTILEAVRDLQLSGELTTAESAKEHARRMSQAI